MPRRPAAPPRQPLETSMSASADMSANRLGREQSPYLLQHKDNPVHWMPWGREAFSLPAVEDKPILLSTGYAACHWCLFMAQESFEDRDTAELMNQNFIKVKFDRE